MAKYFLMSAQENLSKLNRGPKVRMYHLSEELRKINDEFILISGSRRERLRQNLKYIFSKKIWRTHCAYFEPATSSSTLSDIVLMLMLRIFKTKIALYVRDAFQMYPEYRSDKYFKHRLLNKLWFISQWFYKIFSHILYFQSAEMSDLFDHPNKRILMPAGKKRIKIQKQAKIITFFYIGGIGKSYNVEMMLQAIDNLNNNNVKVNLLMFCRAAEMKSIASWLSKSWLSIEHKTLDDLDIQVDAGMILLRVDDLNNRIIPIKVFDYMSLGVPIFASNAKVLASFVESKGIGIVSEWNSPSSLEKNIRRFLSDQDLRDQLKHRSLHHFEKYHQWKHRAKQIMDDLAGVK